MMMTETLTELQRQVGGLLAGYSGYSTVFIAINNVSPAISASSSLNFSIFNRLLHFVFCQVLLYFWAI